MTARLKLFFTIYSKTPPLYPLRYEVLYTKLKKALQMEKFHPLYSNTITGNGANAFSK